MQAHCTIGALHVRYQRNRNIQGQISQMLYLNGSLGHRYEILFTLTQPRALIGIKIYNTYELHRFFSFFGPEIPDIVEKIKQILNTNTNTHSSARLYKRNAYRYVLNPPIWKFTVDFFFCRNSKQILYIIDVSQMYNLQIITQIQKLQLSMSQTFCFHLFNF